ncbi:MAG TPA: HNH endonuclease signature motif containing protein [Trebonia sp.]|jgi:5-methylcytosine-specific restriction endonuclease McrA|nr:HNH endonuclease signature motif containing protein [Trebonia sp.]
MSRSRYRHVTAGAAVSAAQPSQLHFDHVIPVSRGGANTVANIQLLCGPGNRAKAAKQIRRPAS